MKVVDSIIVAIETKNEKGRFKQNQRYAMASQCHELKMNVPADHWPNNLKPTNSNTDGVSSQSETASAMLIPTDPFH